MVRPADTMEINFSPARVISLLILLVGFGLLGGYVPPKVVAGGYHSATAVGSGWFGCLALFVTGAGCATVVDHWTGNLDRWNVRPAYMVVGVLLMVTAWMLLEQVRLATAS